MKFHVYHIQSIVLKQYVQYILFNYCDDKHYTGVVRSFANTNYCLGITKDIQLQKEESDKIFMLAKPGVHSYITGIYLSPFNFIASGMQDEICIDFTPLGYYHFFRFSPKTFMLHGDILSEAFGKNAVDFFEKVFEQADFKMRGMLIEEFLKKKLCSFNNPYLSETVALIHKSDGNITVNSLAKQMKSSEKKIFRNFISHFDISPKEYIRVCRFRKTLQSLINGKGKLASAAYNFGFSDQSHMIREFSFFTKFTPAKIGTQVKDIENAVLVNVS